MLLTYGAVVLAASEHLAAVLVSSVVVVVAARAVAVAVIIGVVVAGFVHVEVRVSAEVDIQGLAQSSTLLLAL